LDTGQGGGLGACLYDLEKLAADGADFSSPDFVALVDQKLAELKEPPLRKQPPSSGIDERRLRTLKAGLCRELPAVLQVDAAAFDLDKTLARFDRLWEK
jgi:hypothetical protein